MGADKPKAEIIFVLGAPCAGKGYLCSRAVQEMENINHCCMGDMLRTERDRPDSPWAEQIQHQMREGGLVRPELSVELLESYISQAINASNKRIILDGFPRSIEQAVLFEQKIGYCTAAVSLQCPKDVMIGRLLKRQETSGRIDDNLEVFEKRYKGYLKDTMPVIEHLKMAETRLVEVSSAENGEEGWIRFRTALESIFENNLN